MLWPIYYPAPPHPTTNTHTNTDQMQRDIVQMLITSLHAVVSLQELKEATEQDPVLSVFWTRSESIF